MTEMVERGARAIAEEHGRNWHELRDSTDDPAWDDETRAHYRQLFRAALQAMREPTEAMADAVGSDWGPQLEDNWRRMIDAALRS